MEQSEEKARKIQQLLCSGDKQHIALAYQLAKASPHSLWPLERGLKDLLYQAQTSPVIAWENLPLGELAYLVHHLRLILIKLPKKYSSLPDVWGFISNTVLVDIEAPSLLVLPQSMKYLRRVKKVQLKHCTSLQNIPQFLFLLPHISYIGLYIGLKKSVLEQISLEPQKDNPNIYHYIRADKIITVEFFN